MQYTRRSPEIKKPRRMSVSIPERAGPHVRLAFAEMQRQGWTYDRMEEKSGVKRPALKAWRYKNYPSLQNLTAVLSVLGLDFIPVPRAEVLPPEVVKELRPIAERLGLEMPQAIQALVEIAAGIHPQKAPKPKPRSPLRFSGRLQAGFRVLPCSQRAISKRDKATRPAGGGYPSKAALCEGALEKRHDLPVL